MEGTMIIEVKIHSSNYNYTLCAKEKRISSSRHLAVIVVYFLWFYFKYSYVGTGRELQGQSMGGGLYEAIPVE